MWWNLQKTNWAETQSGIFLKQTEQRHIVESSENKQKRDTRWNLLKTNWTETWWRLLKTNWTEIRQNLLKTKWTEMESSESFEVPVRWRERPDPQRTGIESLERNSGKVEERGVERMKEGHCQSDEHWNCFKGNVGETSERHGEAHVGFSERTDTILNWTEGFSVYSVKTTYTFTASLWCQYLKRDVEGLISSRQV